MKAHTWKLTGKNAGPQSWGQRFCASLRNRNAHGHCATAILCGNLQEKMPHTTPPTSIEHRALNTDREPLSVATVFGEKSKKPMEWLGGLGLSRRSMAAASPLFSQAASGTVLAMTVRCILCLQRIAVLLGNLRLMTWDRIAPREMGHANRPPESLKVNKAEILGDIQPPKFETWFLC